MGLLVGAFKGVQAQTTNSSSVCGRRIWRGSISATAVSILRLGDLRSYRSPFGVYVRDSRGLILLLLAGCPILAKEIRRVNHTVLRLYGRGRRTFSVLGYSPIRSRIRRLASLSLSLVFGDPVRISGDHETGVSGLLHGAIQHYVFKSG